MTTINNNNRDLILFRYAEGMLDDQERIEVEQWLDAHPDEAEALRLYAEAPRLEADETAHYSRPLPGHTRQLWPATLRWTAVAAVVVAVVATLFLHRENSENVPLVAEVETPAPSQSPTPSETPMPVPAPHINPQRATLTTLPAVPDSSLHAIEEYVAEDIAPFEEEDTIVEIEDTSIMAPEIAPQLLFPAEIALDEPTTSPAQEEAYDDDPFANDKPHNALNQQVVALNNTIHEWLQGSYLGRRLSRRLPNDEELMVYVTASQEHTPRGILVVADFFATLAKTEI